MLTKITMYVMEFDRLANVNIYTSLHGLFKMDTAAEFIYTV